MRELGRLSDALRAERQLYVNITQSGSGDRESSPRSADSLTIELAAVQTLRRQLEDGIRRNDAMREQLEKQVNQGDHRGSHAFLFSLMFTSMRASRHSVSHYEF